MSDDDLQSPFEAHEFHLPRVLGEYCLDELLGCGEYSCTFKGSKQNTHEVVAIKVFSKSSDLAKELYISEIKAYRALKGRRGILQCKDNGEIEEIHFIVTDYVKEGSLRRVLEQYPQGMKIEDVIQLFTPIAEAVESNLISLPARWPFDHAVVFPFASGAKTSRNDHLLELALYVIHHSLA